MPPEAGSPRDWLRLAKADLAIARLELPPDGLLELLCFHAQQAAEKSIKAVLLQEETPAVRGDEPPLAGDVQYSSVRSPCTWG